MNPFAFLVNLWGKEPVVITGIVDALAILAVSLGLNVTDDVRLAVDGLIVALGVLVARSQVSPAAAG